MRTILELGQAVATQRKKQGIHQRALALQAGVTRETLSRFERGKLSELGSRKLLALLAVLGFELDFVKRGFSGSLDELLRERSG